MEMAYWFIWSFYRCKYEMKKNLEDYERLNRKFEEYKRDCRRLYTNNQLKMFGLPKRRQKAYERANKLKRRKGV